MRNILICVACVAALSGCKVCRSEPDKTLRQELFFKCLEISTQATNNGDSMTEREDIVSACGSEAYSMSLRMVCR